jgi:hypothetical protein
MLAPDLYGLRQHFDQERILLCFNGPISRSLIEEIGNALRNYMKTEQTSPGSAMDVFAVYIELTQNIRHYAGEHQFPGADTATVMVSFRDGHYHVAAGNMVKQADGDRLLEQVEQLASLDKTELKSRYKQQLRQPRDQDAATGAGLGLIDMARKATAPIQAGLKPLNDGFAFLSISVQI